jgi:hypothetical protein
VNTEQKQAATSALLGAKLLAGWAMLASACPDPACRGTPLVQRKGKPPKLCVCCSAEYDATTGDELHSTDSGKGSGKGSGNGGDGNSVAKVRATAAAASPAVAPTLPPWTPSAAHSHVSGGGLGNGSFGGGGGGGFGSSGDGGVGPYGGKLPSAFEVAAAGVSAHLVRGWALHADECGECLAPTMSHPSPLSLGGSADRKVCVNAGCTASIMAFAAATPGAAARARARDVAEPTALAVAPAAAPAAPAAPVGLFDEVCGSDDVRDSDDDGYGLLGGADYAQAEAAYRAQRFGAPLALAPPAAPEAAPPSVAAVAAPVAVGSSTAVLAAARERAATAVAAKLHWCAATLEDLSADPQAALHTADLMLKLVQTANALSDNRRGV